MRTGAASLCDMSTGSCPSPRVQLGDTVLSVDLGLRIDSSAASVRLGERDTRSSRDKFVEAGVCLMSLP